ncbi:hypothetical protein GC088_04445 [Arthrobacter sp. JZ12]|uniref:hypothetical protein n=1 Tax=Arthrobacter sp. JZ12 TaxID=2654190 RepID=UPI002B482D40|nr:hypothetical protein [Arthrobacter sp. JZ12]WRH24410.1 hypothetical protein GC088_04445 [Arthrobacter sp. JZ12]
MTSPDEAPLLDLSVLVAMETDFHDPEPVHQFVRNFIEIWDKRYTRLVNASRHRDPTEAQEVLLGIMTSSRMLGATQLAALAGDLETRLSRGAVRVPRPALSTLADCGERTVKQLADEYLGRGAQQT